MLRRLQIYNEINNEEKGNSVLIDFFKQNNIEIKNLEDQNDLFYKMKAFIERVNNL
jgi:hypothetical protein